MTRVENLGQTFPRIHAVPYVRTYHLLFRTSISPEGEERQGGKNRRLFKSVTCTILKAIDIR